MSWLIQHLLSAITQATLCGLQWLRAATQARLDTRAGELARSEPT